MVAEAPEEEKSTMVHGSRVLGHKSPRQDKKAAEQIQENKSKTRMGIKCKEKATGTTYCVWRKIVVRVQTKGKPGKQQAESKSCPGECGKCPVAAFGNLIWSK